MPGAIVIIRIPRALSSRAIGSVIPTTAALEAATAVSPISPSNALESAVLIIKPRCLFSFGSFFDISSAARRMTLNVPIVFT